jgi:hypothetical protein
MSRYDWTGNVPVPTTGASVSFDLPADTIVEVRFWIQHPNDGQMRIALVAPDAGAVILMHNRMALGIDVGVDATDEGMIHVLDGFDTIPSINTDGDDVAGHPYRPTGTTFGGPPPDPDPPQFMSSLGAQDAGTWTFAVTRGRFVDVDEWETGAIRAVTLIGTATSAGTLTLASALSGVLRDGRGSRFGRTQ